MNQRSAAFAQSPASGEPGKPASFERHWAILSMRGNQAFACGKRQIAATHYGEALRLARAAIILARDCDDSVPDSKLERWLSIWVISHLNLSDFHGKAADFERAMETLFAAYEEIVSCLHDKCASTRVHRVCLQHLRTVLDALRDLMTGAGLPQEHTDRTIARAQSLALGYWKVWA
jgi:hypothetical protein